MGRRYSSTNTFSPWDSNCIDDLTGFKRKRSELKTRWEGWLTDQGWNPRHPQDFPVIPVVQETFGDIRIEDLTTEDVETFDKI